MRFQFPQSPRRRPREQGFTLVEVMFGLGLTCVIALAFSTYYSNTQTLSTSRIKRWRAQLVAESITDSVASLMLDDLDSLLRPTPPDASGYFKFDAASQPWLAQWSAQPGIQGVSFKVRLLTPYPALTALTALPAAKEAIFQYNREITTQVDYKRLDSSAIESITWSKTLMAMRRPAVMQISMSPFKSCALRDDSTVKCWDPAAAMSPTNLPQTMTELGENVQSISMGTAHACASYENGSVVCWGSNSSGQLGSDPLSTGASTKPIVVPGLPADIGRVAAGDTYSCALSTTQGQVWCWGSGFNGGHTPALMSAPGGGSNLQGVNMISAQNQFLAISLQGGSALQWTTNTAAPLATTNLTTTSQIASGGSGAHFCTTLTTQGAECWGSNASGQLGNGTTGASLLTGTTVLTSSTHTALTGVASIATGTSHSCAALTNGTAYCWGSNTSDQLGSSSGSSYATQVTGLPTGRLVQSIFAGGDSSCALLDDKSVYCWGVVGGGALSVVPPVVAACL